jgi:hypothetical protein
MLLEYEVHNTGSEEQHAYPVWRRHRLEFHTLKWYNQVSIRGSSSQIMQLTIWALRNYALVQHDIGVSVNGSSVNFIRLS